MSPGAIAATVILTIAAFTLIVVTTGRELNQNGMLYCQSMYHIHTSISYNAVIAVALFLWRQKKQQKYSFENEPEGGASAVVIERSGSILETDVARYVELSDVKSQSAVARDVELSGIKSEVAVVAKSSGSEGQSEAAPTPFKDDDVIENESIETSYV